MGSKITYKKAISMLEDADNIVILIHAAPDGDAVGSAFAMYYLLTDMDKTVRILCPDEIPSRYSYLCPSEEIRLISNCREIGFEPELIMSVDLADPQLLGDFKCDYEDKIVLSIDHHISNTLYADNILLNSDASAACEVVYKLIKEWKKKITDIIAACLYTGISTDTGCYKFANTTAETHRITAELLKNNKFDFAGINRLMFEIKSSGRIRLEGILLNSVEFFFGNKVAILTITKENIDEHEIKADDLEGITFLVTQIEGVEIGVVIKEKEGNEYKISLRSTGESNVSEICKNLGGGGHIRAAGCRLDGNLDEVKQKLLKEIEKVI
jgi:phosphoesterase RecJ-like protein